MIDTRTFTDADMAAADWPSNDYAERSIAARNYRYGAGMLASCGTCDAILDAGVQADVQHAVDCAIDAMPYQYGR